MIEFKVDGKPCTCRICMRLREINRKTQDKLKKSCGIDSVVKNPRQTEREQEPWWNRV